MSFLRRQYDRIRNATRRARPENTPKNMSPKKETAEHLVNHVLDYVRSIDPDTPTLVGYRKWIEHGSPDVTRLYTDQFIVAYAQRVHKQRILHLPEDRQHDAAMYALKHMFVKKTADVGYLKRTRKSKKNKGLRYA